MNMKETRYTHDGQHGSRAALRQSATGTPTHITGFAAVFFNHRDPGTEYRLTPSLNERIMPGAFDRALREKQDAMSLYNHNPDHLLGRVANGTLSLSVDGRGLRYDVPINTSDPTHTMVVEKLKRGDLRGSSFSFKVVREEFERAGNVVIRKIQDVDLFDTGPVSQPAYSATAAGVRAILDRAGRALTADPHAAKLAAMDHAVRLAAMDCRIHAR